MRKTATTALAIGLCLSFARAVPAQAATEAAFTQSAFEASEKAGRPILVHVTAPWCPTCAAQKPTIEKLAADPTYQTLVIYKVDFDSQKDVLRALGVRSQSTLIAFHGATEADRSTGDTNAASIEALVAKTLR